VGCTSNDWRTKLNLREGHGVQWRITQRKNNKTEEIYKIVKNYCMSIRRNVIYICAVTSYRLDVPESKGIQTDRAICPST
jgi:hypothetical protein